MLPKRATLSGKKLLKFNLTAASKVLNACDDELSKSSVKLYVSNNSKSIMKVPVKTVTIAINQLYAYDEVSEWKINYRYCT